MQHKKALVADFFIPGSKITVTLAVASCPANLLRVLSLVSIGCCYELGTMLIFHAFLGWALFAAIILPMAYVYLK